VCPEKRAGGASGRASKHLAGSGTQTCLTNTALDQEGLPCEGSPVKGQGPEEEAATLPTPKGAFSPKGVHEDASAPQGDGQGGHLEAGGAAEPAVDKLASEKKKTKKKKPQDSGATGAEGPPKKTPKKRKETGKMGGDAEVGVDEGNRGAGIKASGTSADRAAADGGEVVSAANFGMHECRSESLVRGCARLSAGDEGEWSSSEEREQAGGWVGPSYAEEDAEEEELENRPVCEGEMQAVVWVMGCSLGERNSTFDDSLASVDERSGRNVASIVARDANENGGTGAHALAEKKKEKVAHEAVKGSPEKRKKKKKPAADALDSTTPDLSAAAPLPDSSSTGANSQKYFV